MILPSTPQRRENPAGLSIVVVSANSCEWLDACLSTAFARAGSAALDVIVVDNESTDRTCQFVDENFPAARVICSLNRRFAHGNNRRLETTSATLRAVPPPRHEASSGPSASWWR